MTQISVSRSLVVALVLSLIPVSLMAQKPAGGTPGNTGNTTTTTGPSAPTTNPTPRPSIPTTTNPNFDFTRPIFLRGRVVLDQGMQLSEPVAIQRVCNGQARREGYTDSEGNFSIQVGDNSNFQDASESGAFGGTRPTQVNARQLWNCELRAVLPGYISSIISLAGRDFNDPGPIGNIVLHRIGGAEGNSISVTSLKAPDKAKHEYQKALENYQDKKFSDVEKHTAKAVELYPQYAVAWELRGKAQIMQHHDDEAMKSFEAAISADDKLVSPYIRLASMYSLQSNWKEVLRLSDRATTLDPLNYPDAWLLKGAAQYNLKQFPDAERSTAKVLDLDKDHHLPRAELLMGSLLQIKQNYGGAAEHFRTFLKYEPKAPEAAQINSFLAKYDQQTASAQPAAVQKQPKE